MFTPPRKKKDFYKESNFLFFFFFFWGGGGGGGGIFNKLTRNPNLTKKIFEGVGGGVKGGGGVSAHA